MEHLVNNACLVIKPSSLEIRQIPYPSIGNNDVLVKVEVTGICGSDLHTFNHGGVGKLIVREPLVIGHESAGTVLQVGSLVTDIAVGDRVAIEPTMYCRRCYNCKTGKTNVCKNMRQASLPPTPGTLAQYYACDSDYIVKIPETISWEEAGCIQPLAVAVQLAKRANFAAGQILAVFGCGPLGCLVMGVARAHGVSKIVAFDISPKRVEFAKQHFADYAAIPPSRPDEQSYEDWAEEFKQTALTAAGIDPWGVDIAVEASGAESCMHAGISFVRSGGTYVQAGLGRAMNLFPTVSVVAKELTVVGTVRYTAGCFPSAIDLVASGKINIKEMVTGVFPLSRSREALEALQKGEEMKVVIMNQQI